MNHNAIETILGAVVLAIAGIFVAFALSTADIGQVEGYTVSAQFSQATGISSGNDVRISGVKVGSVQDMSLDTQTYLANITLSIDPSIQLPIDTVAKISSEGLLGGKFLALEPGADELMLKDGDRIAYTQSAVNLEEMIGKFMFNGAESGSNKETK